MDALVESLLDRYSCWTEDWSSSSSSVPLPVPVYVIHLESDRLRYGYMRYLCTHVLSSLVASCTAVHVQPIDPTDPDIRTVNTACHQLSGPVLGCLLSHLWCLRHALQRGDETFLIVEDDIIMHKEFATLVPAVLQWPLDLVQLGACDFHYHQHRMQQEQHQSSSYYVPTENVLGGHANLYHRKAAQALYDYQLRTMCEFDKAYRPALYEKGIRVGVCSPALLLTEGSTSHLHHQFFSPWMPQLHSVYANQCGLPVTTLGQTYRYLLIDLLDFAVPLLQVTEWTWERVVDAYVMHRQTGINHEACKQVRANLLYSGWTIDDLQGMTRMMLLGNPNPNPNPSSNPRIANPSCNPNPNP